MDSSGHQHFDEMAFGHVLGGLDEVEAAAFRTHLLGCKTCRRRVAELRGMAADLQAAARADRAETATKTATQRRLAAEDADDGDGGEPHTHGVVQQRVLPIAMATLALLVIVLGAWNLQLRTVNDELQSTTAVRERILDTVGTGRVVPAEFAGGTVGTVAADDERVAVVLSNVPAIAAGERIVVWLTAYGNAVPVGVHTGPQLVDRRLATALHNEAATRLQVSIESVDLPATPTGLVLVDADLTVVRSHLADAA